MTKATQDAQVAKQAKAQIAFAQAANDKAAAKAAKAKPQRIMTAAELVQIAANVTKRDAENAAAATVVAAALAKHNAKPQPAAAPLPKGSVGKKVPVGVAQGAMDGQPHTKLAVQQARAAANAAFVQPKFTAQQHAQHQAQGRVLAKCAGGGITGQLAYVVPTDKLYKGAHTMVKTNYPAGIYYASEEFMASATKPTAAAKAKAAKAKTPKAAKQPAAPKADQPITVLDKAYTFGAAGTARRASWDACLASKSTAAYAAKGGATKYLARWVAAKAIRLG